MKFTIKHDVPGRIRVHMDASGMTFIQADTLQYYLKNLHGVTNAKVYERTADAVVEYRCSRKTVIEAIAKFRYSNVEVPEDVLATSGRAINSHYTEKLADQVLWRMTKKLFIPAPVCAVLTTVSSMKYIYKGIRTLLGRKLEVPVLDATAIGVSILRRDFNTAGSVMFLLGIGEIIEDWTHKKSVDDLARTMSLNVNKVWLKTDDAEVQVSVKDVKDGDNVIIRMGNVIPFDGTVISGEAMVNQASLTGESEPVRRGEGTSVFAGTVVEEGEIVFRVKRAGGSSKYDKIVRMIEESEKLKSGLESKAEHLADKLVPYSLGGTALTYLLTRNTTKALSILMVDFSCALKLTTPLSVISAMKEASDNRMMVKGGKFLEKYATADTIVFDKTGTLTNATPKVVDVISLGDYSRDEILRMSACIEEHFAHSIATAIVKQAEEEGLKHDEDHSEVEYIVAHGIATSYNGKRAVIGSRHFLFDDEGVEISKEDEKLIDEKVCEYSVVYLAIDNKLEGIICINDPVRKEARDVIEELKKLGIENVIMLTGDSESGAKSSAEALGITEYRSQVLPEDKASIVESLKEEGRTIIMVGDGINDSPALAAADVSVSMKNSSDIAREVADVSLLSDNLYDLITLRKLSVGMLNKIDTNYHSIIGINGSLIALGMFGIITPSTSSLIHNLSTMLLGALSTRSVLKEPREIEVNVVETA